MFKHIILATDGSAHAQKAADTAMALAKHHGSRVTAVFVFDPYPYMTLGADSAAAFGAYQSAAKAAADEARNALAAKAQAADVPFEMQVIEGRDVASGILEVAEREGADLLVQGSHGRTGIERLILGNVASKILSMTRLPVLVVR